MNVEILIQNGSKIYFPIVKDGVKLCWERKGVPGKLEFTVVKDGVISFQEGNPVKLTVDGTPMFYGFVFKKNRGRGNTIKVTAYDQLRYLKNKDTIQDHGLTASDLLKRIATDFRLNLGTVEDTAFKIATTDEQNQTLFDMIQNALDATLLNTGNLFILYDDVGKLTLKNINSLKVNLLIDAETAENFDYTSSIDDQTFTKVKLTYENEKAGKRELYVAQDGDKMNRWGVLQYYEEIKNPTGAAEKAKTLLKMYGTKTRNLTIKKAFGDVRVRAGSAVMISLNLGDIVAKQFLVVDKVTHNFKGEQHTMDLTLIGGEFVA